MTDIALRRSRVPADLTPPTDEEKYAYIKGRQHRWLWLAHLISFVGIAISLYGLSRMTYWTLLFLLPLSVYGIETLLGVWTSTFRRRFTLLDHAALIELSAPAQLPAIDVFIPTRGEPLRILLNTFRHVSRIEYTGELAVFVLDDAGDERVAQAAGEFGFTYLARPTHEFKKAGNLQYAFERTAGEHILLLDADFVPRPDVLTEVVPHMVSDPHIGIVQTPQYYPTGLPGLGWLERCASATQETFYRFIQPSRDAVSAAVCCGTSALYRRSALQASGGFPQIEHSEDMFTGVEMMAHGYRTSFLPLNLTQGLCPADLDPFISQQYRWCAGSLQLMRTRAFHADLDLSIRQRAAYWSVSCTTSRRP